MTDQPKEVELSSLDGRSLLLSPSMLQYLEKQGLSDWGTGHIVLDVVEFDAAVESLTCFLYNT